MNDIKLANEINNLVISLLNKNVCSFKEDDLDVVDIKYAEAILNWRPTKDIKSFFETDNEVFLFFRKELQNKFELEILSSNEAKARRTHLQTMLLSPVVLIA